MNILHQDPGSVFDEQVLKKKYQERQESWGQLFDKVRLLCLKLNSHQI